MPEQIVRGPLLIPREDGSVVYHADGVLAANADGMIEFAGAFEETKGVRPLLFRRSDGVMLPPLLDVHTHVPQHPIRGRFVEGVPDDAPGGKLLAGLARNVFPAEAKCATAECAEKVVRQFLADTLAHGVVGGAVYMTVSAQATEIALSILPDTWSVGLVLMNQNCPDYLRTNEALLEADVEGLAKKFGRRLIVTDRFAVAVDSPLRRQGVRLAARFGLRTQTHLNEQTTEKQLVEQKLYPHQASYTDVYQQDGLLDHDCIAAHCIHMRHDEWPMLRDSHSAIAHCPTSNLLLGSGVMDLAAVLERKIPYAIATDVGASPTVSMLAEMGRFLQVHRQTSNGATAVEALYRATRAPANILGLARQLGRLEPGMPMSFIEVGFDGSHTSAESVIRSLIPTDLDHPAATVNRVTLAGKTVHQRSGPHA
jgi:guanine deaminase